jgi:hypothetical protein
MRLRASAKEVLVLERAASSVLVFVTVPQAAGPVARQARDVAGRVASVATAAANAGGKYVADIRLQLASMYCMLPEALLVRCLGRPTRSVRLLALSQRPLCGVVQIGVRVVVCNQKTRPISQQACQKHSEDKLGKRDGEPD